MSTTTAPPPPLVQSANSTVQVDSAQAVKATIPTISMGDVINVTVRQNLSNGQGLLNYQGALIPARLPGYLLPGDQLTTKVTHDSTTLLFKILDIKRPAQTGTASQIVASRLEQFLAGSEVPLLGGMKSFDVPSGIRAYPPAQAPIAQFEASVGNAETLSSSGTVLDQLTGTTDGSLAKTLRDIASSLRTVADSYIAGGDANLADILRAELGRLASQSTDFTPSAVKDLIQIVEDAQSKSTAKAKGEAGDSAVLRQLLEDISQDSAIPARLRSLLPAIIGRLETAITEAARRSGGSAPNELRQLATRLEQMAGNQEMLNQLNPLMHALGEPALILFPSLFQGLLAQSELLVQPRDGGKQGKQGKKKGKKKGSKEDSEGDDGPDSSSYQRVQMTVPMPTMGLVGVDVAHRETEILVRLTVPDEDVARFLLDQLEYLAVVLKDIGFEKAELVANVGLLKEDTPAWCSGLQPSTTFVA